jgi:hypothetical protein
MIPRVWSRGVRLTAAALLLAASPALATAQSSMEEDVHSVRESTLHGCYRFVCLTDRLTVEAHALGTVEDPNDMWSWWGADRWIELDVGAGQYMIDLPDEPGRFVAKEPFWEGRCCDVYSPGGGDVLLFWRVAGQDGGVPREAVLPVIARPIASTATFFIYTPHPGWTPPPGATDLRPYSIKFTITIGENGLVRGVSSVPEPSTVALTGGGLLALAMAARRRRRA